MFDSKKEIERLRRDVNGIWKIVEGLTKIAEEQVKYLEKKSNFNPFDKNGVWVNKEKL